MGKRPFRNPESYNAERITRDRLKVFLEMRGFSDVDDQRKSYGANQSQMLLAVSPDGERLAMRVRLCWRRTEESSRKKTYSAAQLLSKIDNGDWEGSIQKKINAEINTGATSFLIVQEISGIITYAALIPIKELLPIWRAQRDISSALIKNGKMGGRHKNHAMNGVSPTIWLRDDKAPSVADALWKHKGVSDLSKLPLLLIKEPVTNDTFNDLDDIDTALIGNDGATRTTIIITSSHVPRDGKVRSEVRKRAKGRCERTGCGAKRDYPGFLDVHHIIGIEKSDRVWTCVALCPNCHREAHYSPDRLRIENELLAFASQFDPRTN